jgi:hypothetical protein
LVLLRSRVFNQFYRDKKVVSGVFVRSCAFCREYALKRPVTDASAASARMLRAELCVHKTKAR